MSSTNTTDDRLLAIRMLQDRGVDGAEMLLENSTPSSVVRTCKWWDSKKNVGTGLLVSTLRKGGVEEVSERPNKRQEWMARFEVEKEKRPLGSSPESHNQLQAIEWPDDERCAGDMIVIDHWYPYMKCKCNKCDYEADYLIAKPPGGGR